MIRLELGVGTSERRNVRERVFFSRFCLMPLRAVQGSAVSCMEGAFAPVPKVGASSPTIEVTTSCLESRTTNMCMERCVR